MSGATFLYKIKL